MNIREIAKEAEVSVATVSRVLNDSKNVSVETRRRVLEVLEQYGFQMDPAAKRLASKRTVKRVLIMVSRRIMNQLDSENKEFYSKVIEGIRNAARLNRTIVELEVMEDFLDVSKLENVDGVLLVGGDTTTEHVRFFKKMGMPIVLVDQYIPTVKVDCVVSNGYDGACYAIWHLINRGMTKIVHIHGFLNHFGFKDRHDGYVSTMEKNRLLPKTYEYNDDVMEDMKPVLEKMLSAYGIPEAIFASNDPIAITAIKTLDSLGIKVPGDVSVVGFDGTECGKLFKPSITTMKVPMYEMGSLAMKRLLDIMSKQDEYPVRISLFTEFVKRSSTV